MLGFVLSDTGDDVKSPAHRLNGGVASLTKKNKILNGGWPFLIRDATCFYNNKTATYQKRKPTAITDSHQIQRLSGLVLFVIFLHLFSELLLDIKF